MRRGLPSRLLLSRRAQLCPFAAHSSTFLSERKDFSKSAKFKTFFHFSPLTFVKFVFTMSLCV